MALEAIAFAMLIISILFCGGKKKPLHSPFDYLTRS